MQINKQISAARALEFPDLSSLVQLPLSEQAFSQLQYLQEAILSRSANSEKDKWTCVGQAAHYSAKRVYRFLAGATNNNIFFKWI
jgi:hypothetical protein